MNKLKQLPILISIIVASSALITACYKPTDSTPTLSLEQIQTQAVGTFAAGLTQTEAALPSLTPTLTETATITPSSTPQASSTSALIPTNSCYSLMFLKDVTVPDNTNMNPGQTFTKTWRVRNNGSCTWEQGYKLTLVSGNALGGATLSLSKAVNPDSDIELSIAMTAPNAAGSYTGNWRMSTDSGVYFGDGMYVMITVGESPTATKTSAPASLTPTVEAPSNTDTPSP